MSKRLKGTLLDSSAELIFIPVFDLKLPNAVAEYLAVKYPAALAAFNETLSDKVVPIGMATPEHHQWNDGTPIIVSIGTTLKPKSIAFLLFDNTYQSDLMFDTFFCNMVSHIADLTKVKSIAIPDLPTFMEILPMRSVIFYNTFQSSSFTTFYYEDSSFKSD